jgi:hypothetical protein
MLSDGCCHVQQPVAVPSAETWSARSEHAAHAASWEAATAGAYVFKVCVGGDPATLDTSPPRPDHNRSSVLLI